MALGKCPSKRLDKCVRLKRSAYLPFVQPLYGKGTVVFIYESTGRAKQQAVWTAALQPSLDGGKNEYSLGSFGYTEAKQQNISRLFQKYQAEKRKLFHKGRHAHIAGFLQTFIL